MAGCQMPNTVDVPRHESIAIHFTYILIGHVLWIFGEVSNLADQPTDRPLCEVELQYDSWQPNP
jgi:hypothetical protein